MSARAIIATLPEKIKQEHEKEVFNIYIAECARIISQNTAKLAGGNYMSAKFVDVLHPKPPEKRTGEEIAADVIQRLGLEVKQ